MNIDKILAADVDRMVSEFRKLTLYNAHVQILSTLQVMSENVERLRGEKAALEFDNVVMPLIVDYIMMMGENTHIG